MNRDQIRFRARAFADEWADASSEQSDRQPFWDAFYRIFDISRRHVAVYEQAARRASTGRHGWIDMLHSGQMAVEHKSRGEDLDAAMNQLEDYLLSLRDVDRPWLLVACDFGRFKWKNLDTGDADEFLLADLPDNLDQFWWLGGGDKPTEIGLPEVDVNLQATELLANLHDELKSAGYPEHDMREWLTRILFCLFADDTEVWERKVFESFIEAHTRDDGSDLGAQINHVFQILDTAPGARSPNLGDELTGFEYVNGDLFQNRLAIPSCNEAIRDALRRACQYNWGKVSPAIFGSLFQNVMEPTERRQLGAHYTTEENILRTIRPLFLDDLDNELARANTRPALDRLHDKIANLTFFDPACGCGNFLVIAYRELRRIELEILRKRLEVGRQRDRNRALQLEGALEFLLRVRVDQFYGIEVEEFPALIARTALYLTDHLANRDVSVEFGQHFVRFPIPASPHIAQDNAITVDWNELLPAEDADYIFGNPPFVGKKARTVDQQADMNLVFRGRRGTSTLDYVAAWYEKAVDYVTSPTTRIALVSTSSITQGEQVSILWPDLLDRGLSIGFAHRPFRWTSEATGEAAVQVVIIGFVVGEWTGQKTLYEYPDVRADGVVKNVNQINPYLVEADPIFVGNREEPIAAAPEAVFGSMPNDARGKLLISEDEIDEVLADPIASKYVREALSAREMLHGRKRWCLWMVDADPSDIRNSPVLRDRVEAVRSARARSRRATTRDLARVPYLFGEIRQPSKTYLCVPRHTSEGRDFIPMIFAGNDIIATDSTVAIPDATMFDFGVLQSAMFGAWQRGVGGRLEGRLRFSVQLSYNNFPYPDDVNPATLRVVEAAANAVIVARANHHGVPLADLYDPIAMPVDLVQAHLALDIAVDSAFRYGRRSKLEADRLAFLLERYERMDASLAAQATPRQRRRRRS